MTWNRQSSIVNRQSADILHSAMKSVDDLLRETEARLSGHFRLSSGLHSPHYIQCARLLEHPRHADDLGARLAEKVRPWNPRRIVAPALGGLIIGVVAGYPLGMWVPMTAMPPRRRPWT